jgi:hypothetical protein
VTHHHPSQHNLADQMPAKLQELRTRFHELAQTTYQTPGLTPPCASYADVVAENGGFWAPFNSSLPYPLTADEAERAMRAKKDHLQLRADALSGK